MIILWWLAVESSEGDVIVDGGARAPVNQVACSG
jgi:hypothetical protein